MTFIINDVPVTYTATASDASTSSTDALAASLATAISTCVQQDPTTLLPFGSLVHATSAANVVTVNPIDPATSFTLSIATTSGAETVAMSGPTAASQTATVTGGFPAGTILTTTVNGLDLAYAVVATKDTATSVATQHRPVDQQHGNARSGVQPAIERLHLGRGIERRDHGHRGEPHDGLHARGRGVG